MDDHASSEEIEWFRNYFKLANMDAFEIIDKAIDVAAHDHPDQLRFLRYRIAHRLFSGSSFSSTWNFEAFAPPFEITDENSVINPRVEEFDQHHPQDYSSNPNKDEPMNKHIVVEDKFEGIRPRLTLRIKTKKGNHEEEQYQDAAGKGELVKSHLKVDEKLKDDRLSKKRVKKALRAAQKSEDAAKSSSSGTKRKLYGTETEVLSSSIRKISKIRFVHGFH